MLADTSNLKRGLIGELRRNNDRPKQSVLTIGEPPLHRPIVDRTAKCNSKRRIVIGWNQHRLSRTKYRRLDSLVREHLLRKRGVSRRCIAGPTVAICCTSP